MKTILLLLGVGWCAVAVQAPRWTRFETAWRAAGSYADPVHDVRLNVEFTSPSGRKASVAGFWDGGRTWRVRFSPGETGNWTYKTTSEPRDEGLDGRTGSLNCVAYHGRNPLYLHGPVRVAADRYHLEHADGAPFLWLGDTAWSGPLKSTPADWETYLKVREAQKFNTIQFVTTQWTAGAADYRGETAFTGEQRAVVNVAYYQRLDEKVNAINAHGMVAAPILLWAHRKEVNPIMGLPDDELIVLARYMVARYGAHQVIWVLNGDSDYLGPNAPRWKRLGREIFSASHPDRIATMHPGGRRWTGDEYVTEPWFAFAGYQSGHRGDEAALRWLTEGPMAQAWRKEPHCPQINMEPNYEAHNDRSPGAARAFDAHDVRRAFYWSLLVAPPAGVTYGGHGIWSWETSRNEPLNHRGTGVAPPWSEAVHLPGAATVTWVHKLFSGIEWWRLRPSPDDLEEQPGKANPAKVVMSATADNGSFGLAYTPAGGELKLKSARPGRARWYNAGSGEWGQERAFPAGTTTFTAPDEGDWVLWRGFAP